MLEHYGRNKVMFIVMGVAYHKTGLHGILFISTVDLLQPPRATVDLLQPPRAPVYPASTARYSTGYCSTTPPRAPLHRPLFIQPSTGLSCSSRGNATGSCTHPHRSLFIQTPPQRLLFIQRQHRSALAAVEKESLD